MSVDYTPELLAAESAPRSSRYSLYVLLVLVLVSCNSALDRQIVSIHAESIKADLRLSDTQLGFLFGTAFAVFHAVFGLVLARIADQWSRQRLVAIALVGWSVLTMCSGMATNFWQMMTARAGVSIGESVASPASFSLLADWFSPRRRATALALYSAGGFVGAGLGLALGGAVAQGWSDYYAGGGAPWGLRGWQVAFFVAGAPGVALAGWVWSLRSPPGQIRAGIAPGRLLCQELSATLPPFSMVALARHGGGPALFGNLLLLAGLAAVAWLLTGLWGDAEQWILLALGCYAAGTWLQSLSQRDSAVAELLIRRYTLPFMALGCGLISSLAASVSLWMAPYLMRTYQLSAGTIGWQLGAIFAVSGWLGVILGGAASDWLRARSPRGRLYVAMLSAALPAPFLWLSLHSGSVEATLGLLFVANLTGTLWVAAGSTTVQETVPAAMRTTASAFYLLVVSFIGMALGPYTVGKLSDVLGDLAAAILWQAGLAALLALVCFGIAARHIHREQQVLQGRSRQA
jgi:MFS family permease